MKKTSGNFIVESQESKGINLMVDYLGYQDRKDIEFPADFETHFAASWLLRSIGLALTQFAFLIFS